METTGLYGITRQALLDNKARIGQSPYFYEVTDAEAIDLDNEFDFNFLEFYVQFHLRYISYHQRFLPHISKQV